MNRLISGCAILRFSDDHDRTQRVCCQNTDGLQVRRILSYYVMSVLSISAAWYGRSTHFERLLLIETNQPSETHL